MNKLTENLNIIQNLANQPTENAKELKRKFDEAGNIIKNYLNDTVEPSVTKIENDHITSTDFNNYKKEIKDNLNAFDTKLQQVKQELSKSIGLSTSYGDFEFTTNNNQLLETNIQYGQDTKTPTFTKEGYKPLAMVGWTTTNKAWNISEVYTKSIIGSSITVYIRGNSMPNHGNIYDSTTVSVHILWVKIKQ